MRHPRPSRPATCKLTLSQPARALPLPGRRAAEGRREAPPGGEPEPRASPAAPGERSLRQAGDRGVEAGPRRGRGRNAPWPGPPHPTAQNGTARPELKVEEVASPAAAAATMGLRAGGALGRAGADRGAPEGPGPSGGAQGGSIHSGCIAAVHNVPLNVLIRPLPSVLDPAKVQSLVNTIRVRPPGVQPAGGRALEEGGRGRREVAAMEGRWSGSGLSRSSASAV